MEQRLEKDKLAEVVRESDAALRYLSRCCNTFGVEFVFISVIFVYLEKKQAFIFNCYPLINKMLIVHLHVKLYINKPVINLSEKYELFL